MTVPSRSLRHSKANPGGLCEVGSLPSTFLNRKPLPMQPSAIFRGRLYLTHTDSTEYVLAFLRLLNALTHVESFNPDGHQAVGHVMEYVESTTLDEANIIALRENSNSNLCVVALALTTSIGHQITSCSQRGKPPSGRAR
jgi:hypothetical protein